eukprot:XP_012817919.1 PREDICTED: dimethylaniline monooxygenase [N-oxide-forming] 2-like [Xenopus tropicalis]
MHKRPYVRCPHLSQTMFICVLFSFAAIIMKVAVIGAGASGLTAIKCCLDEGLEPTCFERSDDIGGVWRFTEHVENGRASIYESLVSNTSKEMMCYSDFPMPDTFPNFLNHTKMMDYYRMYAETFNLLKYIQFKTLVCNIRKHPSFQSTGQWEVTLDKDGKQQTSTFNFVMICTGHYSDPYYPLDSFPSIQQFQGQYFHSRDFKRSDGYKGKKVLIIGTGSSACDIAVELSRTAAQVFLSTRKGTWVTSRTSDKGYPWDACLFTRFQEWFKNKLPSSIVLWWTEKKINMWFQHANYGLQPTKSSQFRELVYNDELLSRIICGSVLVKSAVTEITATSVEFDDGTTEKDIDVVIFATGYIFNFPYFDEPIIKADNSINLYRNIFPASLKKPTLGFIGLIRPLGPFMSVAEVQARWVTRVFKGLCNFPPQEAIMKDIAKKKENFIKRFGKPQQSNSLTMEYIEYLDELTSDIGAKPNILSFLLSDPALGWMLYFGPCTPAQYRLTGPGKWRHARNHIMTTWDRIVKPTRTRVVKKVEKSIAITFLLSAVCALTLLLAALMYQC